MGQTIIDQMSKPIDPSTSAKHITDFEPVSGGNKPSSN